MIMVIFLVVNITYFCISEEEALKKRWKNLRDGFQKCCKKIDNMTRSGAGASKLPTCKCFVQLQFLRDSVSNRPTQSNMIQQEESNTTQAFDFDIPSLPISPLSNSTPISIPNATQDKSYGQNKRKSDSMQYRSSKKIDRGTVDLMLVKALSEDSKPAVKSDTDNDPDVLFCRSIVSTMKELPPKKSRLLKIDIQKLCLKYEFDEDESL